MAASRRQKRQGMSNQIEREFREKRKPLRLNKYLSEAGVCSRREADRLIASGKVWVDAVSYTHLTLPTIGG